jgi:hypothetical protein
VARCHVQHQLRLTVDPERRSPGDCPIQIAKLTFLAVIGGLRGVEQISFLQWIRFDETSCSPS